MNVDQIGIDPSRPKRKRRRHRAGKQFPQAGDTRDWNLSVFMLGAEASVRNNHLELHFVNETLADFFKNSFHSTDKRIIELPELKNSHAAAPCCWEAIALARIRSNLPANSFSTRFCRIQSCPRLPIVFRNDPFLPNISM